MTEKTSTNPKIQELFKAGAHFGFVKSRRHPSAKPFIYGAKNKIEIFDLEKTVQELENTLSFVEEKGRENAPILLVGGKNEARDAIKRYADDIGMPYVAGRWIGGTLTNFTEIKKRLARLEELTTQREKGELGKYTKKERLLIDREIDKLNLYFSGLTSMKGVPKVMVVVDPKREHVAVAEARKMRVPVVALAGSDCNLFDVEHAIPANDSSRQSIAFILGEITTAYKKGKSEAKAKEDKAAAETPVVA
jgi:small subunit ribosomal protein S2